MSISTAAAPGLPPRLSIRDASHRIGLSADGVKTLIRRGELIVLDVPSPKKIPVASVDAWIERTCGKLASAS